MLVRDSRILVSALNKLHWWIEKEQFKGWDPHDALNSPLIRRLAFGNRWLGLAWVQLLRRSPINFRSLLGVPKGYNPKGMGLFLASYLRLYQLDQKQGHLRRVRFFADWLLGHVSPGYSGACWGYNFAWPNRRFFAPLGTPTVVNTVFIGLAFLDLYRAAAPVGELRDRALRVARSACNFLLHDLNVLTSGDKELCLSYTPLDHRYVHNANVLGALLLAEVGAETNESALVEYSLAAARYTARRQRADGSWPYGEGASDSWVDNFHTGFVLVSLKRIHMSLKTSEFDQTLERGYLFWKKRMFLADGRPKYYPHSIYPIDIHSVAQAVLTFLEFSDWDPDGLEQAWCVARWGIEHMQDPKGYFHYQLHRHYRNRIPYMRWSQAWMSRALSELLYRLASFDPTAISLG